MSSAPRLTLSAPVASVAFNPEPPTLPATAKLTLQNGRELSVDVKRLKSGRLHTKCVYPHHTDAVIAKLKEYGIDHANDVDYSYLNSSSSDSGFLSTFARLTAAQNMATGQGNATTNTMAVAGDQSAEDTVMVRAIDPDIEQQLEAGASVVGRSLVVLPNGLRSVGATSDHAIEMVGKDAASLGSGIGRELSPLASNGADLARLAEKGAQGAASLGSGIGRELSPLASNGADLARLAEKGAQGAASLGSGIGRELPSLASNGANLARLAEKGAQGAASLGSGIGRELPPLASNGADLAQSFETGAADFGRVAEDVGSAVVSEADCCITACFTCLVDLICPDEA